MKYGICASSLTEALDLSAQGVETIQLFTGDPYKFDSDTTELRSLAEKFIAANTTFIAHAGLMSNLVSEKSRTVVFSQNSICKEMQRSQMLGIRTVVIHPGSSKDPNAITYLREALRTIEEKQVNIYHRTMSTLAVENMVDSGGHIMTKPEDFIKLFKEGDPLSQNFGVCLDTAHCWGAGTTPLEFITALEDADLIDRLKVVHFNNTKSEYGSHKERHAVPQEGKIPQEEMLGMLDWLALNPQILVVVEQPKLSDNEAVLQYLKESTTRS